MIKKVPHMYLYCAPEDIVAVWLSKAYVPFSSDGMGTSPLVEDQSRRTLNVMVNHERHEVCGPAEDMAKAAADIAMFANGNGVRED